MTISWVVYSLTNVHYKQSPILWDPNIDNLFHLCWVIWLGLYTKQDALLYTTMCYYKRSVSGCTLMHMWFTPKTIRTLTWPILKISCTYIVINKNERNLMSCKFLILVNRHSSKLNYIINFLCIFINFTRFSIII